jgi:hypothetical protein
MADTTSTPTAEKAKAKTPAAAAPKTDATTVPVIPPNTPFLLAECEDRARFIALLTETVDALRSTPKGMEKEDRASFVEDAKRARIRLIRLYPLIEAMADKERFTLSVMVIVKTADGEKTADRRPVRLTDAVYARLGLYGRTMESVGLA